MIGIVMKYPCTDSNCALRLRRPTLCPLSYRGGRQDFIILEEVSLLGACSEERVLVDCSRHLPKMQVPGSAGEDLNDCAACPEQSIFSIDVSLPSLRIYRA